MPNIEPETDRFICTLLHQIRVNPLLYVNQLELKNYTVQHTIVPLLTRLNNKENLDNVCEVEGNLGVTPMRVQGVGVCRLVGEGLSLRG